MKYNLGNDWKSLFSIEDSSTSPGAYVAKDFYAIFVGGNKTYYQLVILDSNWISDTAQQ